MANTKAKSAANTVQVAVVKAVELYRILWDAGLFASKDETLSVLNVVHVESDGKQMRAVANDRFTLGISRIDIEHELSSTFDADGFAFNMFLSDVVALLKIAKTVKKEQHWREVTVTMDNNNDTIVLFTFNSGEAVTYKLADVSFPKWRHLLPVSGSETARSATAYNPEYYARFAKVLNTDTVNQRMVCWTFENSHSNNQRPTAVRVGDCFFGLIMPVRDDITSEPFTLPGWI